MIGASISFSQILSTSDVSFVDSFLKVCKEKGVESIELRTVRPHHTKEDALKAANFLWDRGFSITVHGSVLSVESAVRDVFAPLQEVLSHLRQKKLLVVIHPIAGDNEAMLFALSDHILEQGYPVQIALENNRRLPDKSQGDSVNLVLEAVKAVDRSNVRICFDMGHFAYFARRFYPETADTFLPDPDFWKYVVHTHIHGLQGMTTHFPLERGNLPLALYLEKLSHLYFGVYNLELEFSRYPEKEPLLALGNSVEYLRSLLPPCASVYEKTRKEFDPALRNAATVFSKKEGSHFALIHSTSYLFSTNGFSWGMDLAFRYAYDLAETPTKTGEILKEMKLMVLTHEHRDHFEERTLSQLAKNDTVFLVPDFLDHRLADLGVEKEKRILAHPGVLVTIGPLTFLPFLSCHFRPNGNGVEEYGYFVTSPGAPSMVFPGDIRNYSREHSDFLPMADYCFAHVWLSDNNRDEEDCRKRVIPFSQYMLGFSKRKIILTHLYENARPDKKMWRMEHALLLQKEILSLSPDTKVLIPDWGDILSL